MPKLQASGAFAQALDDNARALNGAYWKVYAAGTTTQATTYSNALLTIANAWPVIGDAAGRLPDIYVAPGNYRIRVETAGGVLIAESDNNVVYGLDPGEVAAAKFKTVPILTDDATMGYSLGGAVSVVVVSGDIIEADGYRYSVLASGATDEDLTTAGGVKLRVLPGTDGKYSFGSFGAVGDGLSDDTIACQLAIDALSAKGGTISGGGKSYLLQTGGLEVNADNIFLENARFVRTSTIQTGWLVSFGVSAITSGGGVKDCNFIGVANHSTGANAGLRMGTDTTKANGWTVENVTFRDFAQFGMGIGDGDNWQCRGVRVFDHGLTTGTISSCIGFYVFPRNASANGVLSDVYAEISTAAMANAGTNCSAIKLQTHQNISANNIVARRGSESCMVLDSISGVVSDVQSYSAGADAGLAVGNQNVAHSFSGQTFVLDGAVCENDGGAFNQNDFVIGGGQDGTHKLTGCILRNISGGGAGYLNFSATKDCIFENWSFADIRFDTDKRGFLANSVASTNNTFSSVRVNGNSGSGVLWLETSNSIIENCGAAAFDGVSVSDFNLKGGNNTLISPFSKGSAGNGLVIEGSANIATGLVVTQVTGRSVWFKTGSGNSVESGGYQSGTLVLDSGDNNWSSKSFIDTDFSSSASALNTVGKYIGKPAYSLTQQAPVFAENASPTGRWRDAVGAIVFTPA